MPNARDAIAVGIIVLAVAVFIPYLVDGTQADKTDIAEIENGSSTDYTDRLTVSVSEVDENNSTATVEVRNSDTLNASEKRLNVSETRPYTIDGEEVNATLEGVRVSPRGQFATVSVVYPPTFGFGQASKTFFGNMEIIIVLVGFIIVLGVLGVVTKS